MKLIRDSKRQAGYVLLLCAAFVATSCESPASPTPVTTTAAREPVTAAAPGPAPAVPPGPPAAVLTIVAFTLTRDYAGDLAPKLDLAETGGSSGALVHRLEFNLADTEFVPRPVVWGKVLAVPAGGTARVVPDLVYGDYEFTYGVPRGYLGRVSVAVSFVDDQGRPGTVTAVAAVPQ
ncbi:MAG: hypothetical protein ACM3H9_04965 [Rhodospirillaceae bacterium]